MPEPSQSIQKLLEGERVTAQWELYNRRNLPEVPDDYVKYRDSNFSFSSVLFILALIANIIVYIKLGVWIGLLFSAIGIAIIIGWLVSGLKYM